MGATNGQAGEFLVAVIAQVLYDEDTRVLYVGDLDDAAGRPCIVYLGTDGTTAILYDSQKDRALRVPLGSVVISVLREDGSSCVET